MNESRYRTLKQKEKFRNINILKHNLNFGNKVNRILDLLLAANLQKLLEDWQNLIYFIVFPLLCMVYDKYSSIIYLFPAKAAPWNYLAPQIYLMLRVFLEIA